MLTKLLYYKLIWGVNMILVQVEHYLSKEGQKLFPEWIERIAHVLQDFDGFISIKRLSLMDHPGECHLLLKFENTNKLKDWVSSDLHDQFVEELAVYCHKKPYSRIFKECQKIEKIN